MRTFLVTFADGGSIKVPGKTIITEGPFTIVVGSEEYPQLYVASFPSHYVKYIVDVAVTESK
ncbi:MAG: hypothetical protein ACAI35_23440 [Candidatus Methylacidiphilales bacterium]|nr:hypothetical protein [Candidatus Methylacidiphilales bacterium]